MRAQFGKTARGFTLYEFAISAGLIGALVGTLLLHTLFYQDEAELVAVRQVVSNIRVALALHANRAVAKGGQHALRYILEENPLDWLVEKPKNYLGEYYSPELKKIPTGNWLFDRRDKCLIYVLSGHKSFSDNASDLLKFKVEFAKLPVESMRKNGAGEVTTGLMLTQVTDGQNASND